jgi:hypothetical protein
MSNLSLSTKNASKCAGWVIRRVCRMKSMNYRLLVASHVGSAAGLIRSKIKLVNKTYYDVGKLRQIIWNPLLKLDYVMLSVLWCNYCNLLLHAWQACAEDKLFICLVWWVWHRICLVYIVQVQQIPMNCVLWRSLLYSKNVQLQQQNLSRAVAAFITNPPYSSSFLRSRQQPIIITSSLYSSSSSRMSSTSSTVRPRVFVSRPDIPKPALDILKEK